MSVLNKIKSIIFSLGAIFFAFFFSLNVLSTPVFAEPETNQNQTTSQQQTQTENTEENKDEKKEEESTNTCYDESGSLGWLVCPTTGFLARITDGLYDIIQQYLVIKPLTSDSDSPYHQIWSIFRDFTNVVFVIFFLIIIYSQVTGVGISNYGIKKLLPKIIVSAILINLSYIICAALVDVSNIAGASLKEIFTNVEQNITPTGIIASADEGTTVDFGNILAGLTGGALLAGLAVGATGGLGALFVSLIPVLLGAVVAVGIAYLTVALRQALVYILIMISPLAFVCMLLPNTESWFNKWKKSLTQMLIFYPSFAVLFGASSLVGWTIIAAAEDDFALVLGIAVKVIPLFAAWSLLKMSGTLPGQISSAVNKFAQKPVGAARSLAAESAALRRAQYLGAKPRNWQYGRKFGQQLQDRHIRTAADTQKYLDMAKLRGAAYASEIRDPLTGKITKRGRRLAALEASKANYNERILKNSNDVEKGLGNYAKDKKDKKQLEAIDTANMLATDSLYYEQARTEKIRFDNTQSRQDRINAAFNANSNAQFNATKRAEELARSVNYQDLARYKQISSTLEGDLMGTHLVGANAAADFDSQTKVLGKKFSSYFSYLPPTQELYDRLFQLTGTNHITKDIDPILAGMAALNMRGDTDLVTDVVERMLATKQIRLGTHASQSLANFCMFTAKDSDVFLRRFGKYINLETARVYNEGQSRGKRKNDVLTLNEYITGVYDEYDENGNLVPNSGKSKLSLSQLFEGTPLDKIERTYYDNLATRVRNAYIDKNAEGEPDPAAIEAFKAKMGQIETAVAPAFISAMLKYASGSEQIVNAAADLTGLKKGKDGGWEKRWEKAGDQFYGVGQDFFTERVKNYLKWQTPSQILALRTDVFYPIVATLGNDYIDRLKAHLADPENNPDPIAEISPELLERMDPKDRPVSEIPDWYGTGDEKINDTDSDTEKEEKKKRNSKRKKFRDKLAKAAFMDILFKNKTLDQVMTSRRSGVTAGTKASVRDFLGLDNEDFVDDYRDDVNEHRRQHREERKRQKEEEERRNRPLEEEEEEQEAPEPASETGGDSSRAPILDAEERAQLKEALNQAYYANPDGEAFYEDCISELSRYGLYEIVDQVRDHHERNSYESNEALLDFVNRCLDDDSNF